MEKDLDLRVKRTYSCLSAALKDLLKEETLEEITVNQLCERALVGRRTFYKHFGDKYEFFSFALGEMFTEFLAETVKEGDEENPRRYYEAFFLAYVRFVRSNSELFGPLEGGTMTAVMLFTTSDEICKRLEYRLKSDEKKGLRLLVSTTAAARFLTGAMAQSARYLSEHGDEAERENFTSDMSALISRMFA